MVDSPCLTRRLLSTSKFDDLMDFLCQMSPQVFHPLIHPFGSAKGSRFRLQYINFRNILGLQWPGKSKIISLSLSCFGFLIQVCQLIIKFDARRGFTGFQYSLSVRFLH